MRRKVKGVSQLRDVPLEGVYPVFLESIPYEFPDRILGVDEVSLRDEVVKALDVWACEGYTHTCLIGFLRHFFTALGCISNT